MAGVSFAGSTSGPGQRVGHAFFDRGSGRSRRRGVVPREARFLWLYQFGDESGPEVENDGATRNRKPGGDAALRGRPLQPIGRRFAGAIPQEFIEHTSGRVSNLSRSYCKRVLRASIPPQLPPERATCTGKRAQELGKMKTALYLLGFQGLIGAFDTLFYRMEGSSSSTRLPGGARVDPPLRSGFLLRGSVLHATVVSLERHLDNCHPRSNRRRNYFDALGFCRRDCRTKGPWRRVRGRARDARRYGNHVWSNVGKSCSHTRVMVGKPNPSCR